MSNVIICAGIGAWHPQGVERLEQSLKDQGWQGSVLTWKDEYPPGSPTHQENPYAFKVFAFEEARRQGFRNILWCDSSVWAVKNPEPIFSIIQNQGYYLWDSGHWCDTWINDPCLAHFGLTREQAHSIRMISANIMGFDFDMPLTNVFMERWRKACDLGMFKGPWTKQAGDPEQPPYLGHRHDQSCASLIAHQLDMNLDLREVNCQYFDPDETRMSKTISLTLQGM